MSMSSVREIIMMMVIMMMWRRKRRRGGNHDSEKDGHDHYDEEGK